MRAEGTFTVTAFSPAELSPPPRQVPTGLPVGVAILDKTYSGGIRGQSVTIFTSAFDPSTEVGTYTALESFAGSLAQAEGAFTFVHSASTSGADRSNQHFVIVPGSGVRGLAGIQGAGGLAIDPDGTHRLWFDYRFSTTS